MSSLPNSSTPSSPEQPSSKDTEQLLNDATEAQPVPSPPTKSSGRDPQRHTKLARQRRQQLIEELGGRCALCDSTWNLQVDHQFGRGWNVRKLSSLQRVNKYIEEAKMGLIRVLCLECNSRINPKNRKTQPENPF